MTHANPPDFLSDQDYLSIDSSVIEMFSDRFTLQELEKLAEATDDIYENIDDIFSDMKYEDALKAAGTTEQEMFDQLGQLIPAYIDMVRESFDRIGDESYMTEEEAAQIGLKQNPDDRRFPKLNIADGTRGFAFLQIAAWQKGISDTNVRWWYIILNLFIQTHIAQQKSLAQQ